MEDKVKFYPMSELPPAEDSDTSFSRTVLVYGRNRSFVELGYYDFEKEQWVHFGEGSFLLKCWCFIPNPGKLLNDKKWEEVKHKDYKSSFY